jgi:hypothetical protein
MLYRALPGGYRTCSWAKTPAWFCHRGQTLLVTYMLGMRVDVIID